MPDYSEWEDLVAGVQSRAGEILMRDVAPVAEDIFRKHIDSDIYGAYSPRVYERRWAIGDHVRSSMENENTMLTTSYETANQSIVPGYHFTNRYPGCFLRLLESGNLGIWKAGFPRPVVTNAQKEINTSSRIESAIKRGIKRVIES